MREIKFRAWNIKDGGTFFIEEEFSVSNDGKILFFENGDSFDIPTEFAIQQFTGLLDKNGKEIYEGDILQVWSTNGNEKAYQFVCEIPDIYTRASKENFEVIGNIYENPELLTNTQ